MDLPQVLQCRRDRIGRSLRAALIENGIHKDHDIQRLADNALQHLIRLENEEATSLADDVLSGLPFEDHLTHESPLSSSTKIAQVPRNQIIIPEANESTLPEPNRQTKIGEITCAALIRRWTQNPFSGEPSSLPSYLDDMKIVLERINDMQDARQILLSTSAKQARRSIEDIFNRHPAHMNEIFALLRTRFFDESYIQKVEIRLQNLKMRSRTNLEGYIEEYHSLCDILQAVNLLPDHRNLRMLFVNGLPFELRKYVNDHSLNFRDHREAITLARKGLLAAEITGHRELLTPPFFQDNPTNLPSARFENSAPRLTRGPQHTRITSQRREFLKQTQGCFACDTTDHKFFQCPKNSDKASSTTSQPPPSSFANAGSSS